MDFLPLGPVLFPGAAALNRTPWRPAQSENAGPRGRKDRLIRRPPLSRGRSLVGSARSEGNRGGCSNNSNREEARLGLAQFAAAWPVSQLHSGSVPRTFSRRLCGPVSCSAPTDFLATATAGSAHDPAPVTVLAAQPSSGACSRLGCRSAGKYWPPRRDGTDGIRIRRNRGRRLDDRPSPA